MHWCGLIICFTSVFCFPLRLPVFFPSVFGILSLSLCFCSSLFFCLPALFIPLFFFPLSSLQFLLSSSSGFYPFRLCPLVSVLGSFCVSVFFFVLRPWVFIFSLLSLVPRFPSSFPRVLSSQFVLSSPGFSLQFSGPPFYCLCSVLLFSWYSLVPPQVFLCYFCLSLFRLFFVLVPGLHFFFIPLCASPVFSLFGWFASVFSSSSLGFFCSSPARNFSCPELLNKYIIF